MADARFNKMMTDWKMIDLIMRKNSYKSYDFCQSVILLIRWRIMHFSNNWSQSNCGKSRLLRHEFLRCDLTSAQNTCILELLKYLSFANEQTAITLSKSSGWLIFKHHFRFTYYTFSIFNVSYHSSQRVYHILHDFDDRFNT